MSSENDNPVTMDPQEREAMAEVEGDRGLDDEERPEGSSGKHGDVLEGLIGRDTQPDSE